MTRTQTLRERLQWSQAAMAKYLSVSQPTIFNLEKGQAESGPVARLLDQLGAASDLGVVKVGMTPCEAIDAIFSPFTPEAA